MNEYQNFRRALEEHRDQVRKMFAGGYNPKLSRIRLVFKVDRLHHELFHN